MDFTEIMKQKIDYCSRHTDMPMELQQKAKKLCWEYNKTSPEEKEERSKISFIIFISSNLSSSMSCIWNLFLT